MNSQNNFTKTRIELHKAIQIISLIERSLLNKKEDDSHTNLGWNSKLNSFVTHHINNIYFGIKVDEFKLIITTKDSIVNSFALENKNLDEIFNWLEKTVKSIDFSKIIRKQPFELPFDFNKDTVFNKPDNLMTVVNILNQAYKEINNFKEKNNRASDVRTWPHHFDMASLLVFDSTNENYKSIGVGFSLGDEHINEPYYYILPYPSPKEVGNLKHGNWNTKGFTGPVLKYEEFSIDDKIISEFISDGVNVSKALLFGKTL